MGAYPMEQRKKLRDAIKKLKTVEEKVDYAVMKDLDVDPKISAWLKQLSGTDDKANQLNALSTMVRTLEEQHLEALLSAAPNDLTAFCEYMNPEEAPAFHHIFICEKLMQIESRELMRLMVSLPPGSAKTTYCSNLFPAWYLGRHPHHKYIQAGHTQGFAENAFGKKVRGLVASEKFSDVFPGTTISQESKAAGFWALNNPYGTYLTRGCGQGISGFRAHCAAVDDPFASREDAESQTIRDKVYDWFQADFTTRLLPNSPLFIVATRWHSDDLCGRVEDMSKQGRGLPYEIINLPALAEDNDPLGRLEGESIWPDFFDVNFYLNLKATLPARDWNSLYCGQPMDIGGCIVKPEWFQRYSGDPRKDEDITFKRIVLSVDSAIKATQRSDYTAIAVFGETTTGRHYLLDMVRERVEFPEMCALIAKTAKRWDVSAILIEDKGSGTQYIQTMQGTAPAPIVPINVGVTSKEFRFDAVTPMFEAGLVFLPETGTWIADYEKELLGFPTGKYDDQVDATSQYLQWARSKRRKGGSVKMKGGSMSGSSKRRAMVERELEKLVKSREEKK